MSMRRAEFLALTGLSPDNHKNLVRRDLLPYHEESGSRGKWGKYTPRQVIATVMSLELAGSGLDQLTASGLVVKSDDQLGNAIRDAIEADKAGAPDIWFATICFFYRDGNLDIERRTVVFTTIEKLAATMTEYDCTVADLAKRTSDISMVNLSRILRMVQFRARQNKVDLDLVEIFRGTS